MKLQQINEVRYAGNPRAALKFLQGELRNEMDFLDDENQDDDGPALIYALNKIIEMVKTKKVRTPDDIHKIGDMIYKATGSGDTDLADNISRELAQILAIR